MIPAPIPPNDARRVAALKALDVLDTPPEEEFDAVVKLAAQLCAAPIAFISLIDENRQWLKARVGLDTAETPRDVSLCGHAIAGEGTMVVPDVDADPRFADNPVRAGIHFYAGVPLRTASGHKIGTLCVADHQARTLTDSQRSSLETLAAQVIRLLELRRTTRLQRELLDAVDAGDAAVGDRRDAKTPKDQPTGRAGRWSSWALALAVALGVSTVMASAWVHMRLRAAAEARLEHATERAASALQERTHAYGQILRGAGALFLSSERVTQSELTTYVASQQLDRNYPRLVGLGYAARVPRGRLDAWLAEQRSDGNSLELVTSGDAPDLVINAMVAPLEQNRAALGFDIRSEPARARALARAEATRDLALTDRIRLRRDPALKPGFNLYLALPARDDPRQIAGFVVAALRASDLVAGMQRAAGAGIELRLMDESGALLGPVRANDAPAHVIDVPFADHSLRLEGRPGPAFLSLADRGGAWLVLLLGLGATALATALTLSLRRTEQRARALARRMTQALRAANEALERLATTDGLTGLANRRVFDERIIDEVARARRNAAPLSVALLDVDSFKLYNDNYGHPQGDECLRQVAACLQTTARRAGELVARYGGEELVVILPGSDVQAAAQLADHICDRVASLRIPHAKSAHGVVTVSIGVAAYDSRKMAEAKDLIAGADAALYRAKQGGRNRAEIAT